MACEISLLSHNDNLSGQCKFRTSSVADVWIPMSAPNKWIFAIYNTLQMDVICNGQVERLPIQGEGILQVQPKCTIHHGSIEIAAQNTFETAILGSILPEINISNTIDAYVRHGDNKLTSYHQSNISTLNEMIKTIKRNEEESTTTFTTHDMHHYGLSYILVCNVHNIRIHSI